MTGSNTLNFYASNYIIINGTITDSNPGGDQLSLNLNPDFDSSGSGAASINNTLNLDGGDLTIDGELIIAGSSTGVLNIDGNVVSNSNSTYVLS